ncbi:MAG: thiol-disulfide isomerase/thioredoxin [Gammaproteobacteria bacterium]|jgi:thiol-disulfide isomerase/thioredoxin
MFRVCIKLFLLSLFTMSADAEMKSFDADSLMAIEAKYEGKPFVLALWSIDCPPCFTELSTLAKLHQQQPELNIVLVSTDGVENEKLALQIVGQKQLGSVDNWLFSDSFVESLRYSIDPAWHGELPRSYLYKANGNRFAHSGVLTELRLIQWITQQKR